MKHIKILIIDDEIDLCKIVKKMLNSEGYTSQYATNGLDALKTIKNKKFHIILLDIKMPDMNGIETLKKIKEIDSKVEVIILTGNATIDNTIASFKEGVFDYLQKPFEAEALVSVINRAASKLGLIVVDSNELNKKIGSLIKDYRINKSLTIKELAGKAALSPSLICQVENAKNAASLHTLNKIACALNIQLSCLVDFN